MSRLRTFLFSVSRAAVAAATLLAPTVARAQDNVPPAPTLSRVPKSWVGFAVIFLLVVLVLGVSLIPSKRGHQD